MRLALDSNILVYAALEPDSDKGRQATRLIDMAGWDGVLAAQVLGEYLTVVRRKQPDAYAIAVAHVNDLMAVFAIAPTDESTIATAGRLVGEHRLQFWDAVILTASAAAGASVLLSEDMHEGFALPGIRVLNPFKPENREALGVIFGDGGKDESP